jgi:tRNA pseudouridine synthase 10
VVYISKEISETDLKALTTIQNMIIDQKTPLRVLHRRTLDTRQKTIIKLFPHFINRHFFLLDVTAQAGTYIKEFIHGK